MSSGTFIIQSALSKIGAHSVVSPAPPESITTGMHILNSMRAEWEDEGIHTGMVPLKVPSSELSEPSGITNAVIANLAVKMAPDFEESKVSPILRSEAEKGLTMIDRLYGALIIPKARARSTLPVGDGNKSGRFSRTYFDEGQEIG